ncbi:MAG: hypothetical protein VB081_14900, partial [Christensenella sp.]|nr:hypothetical protein [Christensenella sp.]
NIALRPDPLYVVLMYAIPVAYSFFGAMFGLKCDLNSPKLDWTSEVTVVKQSKPVLLTMLVGMILAIVPALLALPFGTLPVIAAFVLVVVLDILLYRNLMSKGVRQFESL